MTPSIRITKKSLGCPGLQFLPGFLDRLRAIGTGLPRAALQPRIKQVTRRVAEHVQTVNGYRQTNTRPDLADNVTALGVADLGPASAALQ